MPTRAHVRVKAKIDAPNPALARDAENAAKMKRALYLAPRVLPGPVGEMVARELRIWDDMGWRLGGDSLMRRVVDDIIKRSEGKNGGATEAQRAQQWQQR